MQNTLNSFNFLASPSSLRYCLHLGKARQKVQVRVWRGPNTTYQKAKRHWCIVHEDTT